MNHLARLLRDDPLEEVVAEMKAHMSKIKTLRRTENFVALSLMTYAARENAIAQGLDPDRRASAQDEPTPGVSYPRNSSREVRAFVNSAERRLAIVRASAGLSSRK